MDEEEEEGRWWWWWTSARKQESFPVGNGALLRRDAAAMPPPSVAHYCTWIAHTTHTQKKTHCWQCGPFAVHRLSPCLCLSCDPPSSSSSSTATTSSLATPTSMPIHGLPPTCEAL